MAEQTSVEYIDDWDGKVIDLDDITQPTFTIEGVEYKLDLRSANYERFAKDMRKWTERAQKIGGRHKRGAKTKNATLASEQTKAIRDWANQNGYKVSDRGRISQEVQEAFAAAH